MKPSKPFLAKKIRGIHCDKFLNFAGYSKQIFFQCTDSNHLRLIIRTIKVLKKTKKKLADTLKKFYANSSKTKYNN